MSETDETAEEPIVESDAADADGGAEEAPEVKPKAKRRRKSTAVKKPVDNWAEPGVAIPAGAKGPTIARLRKGLKITDGGDKFDRKMKARVEYVQRSVGLPVTGRIDHPTRAYLDTLVH